MTTATPWNPEITEAVENLKEAIDNVRHQADKSTLATVIAKAESIDLSEYIEEGQDTFTAALESAKEIYDDPSATQEEVDAAADALNAAITALRKIANKDHLKELMETAQSIDASDYTAASYQNLANVMAEAQKVLDDNTLAEDDPAAGTTIRNMETRLSAAINSLVENSGNSGSGSGSGSSSSSGSSSGSTTSSTTPLQRRTSLWTTQPRAARSALGSALSLTSKQPPQLLRRLRRTTPMSRYSMSPRQQMVTASS